MNSVDYLHLQMELEGLCVDRDGVITSLGSDHDDPALILMVQTTEGRTVIYFHEVLPVKLREELSCLKSQAGLSLIDPLLSVLDAYGLQYIVGRYKSYVFPQCYIEADTSRATCFQRDAQQVQRLGFDGVADKVFAVDQDGEIVSTCVSVRQNTKCAEAWVFTAPKYRGRGLAQWAVTAWAKSMLQDGIIPFYSHKIDNTASAHLANKLKLIPVFEEIGIERQV